MQKLRVDYYIATERQYSPEYIAFRDRVVADLGTIANADAAQNTFDHLAANPALGFTRYLDSRFGTRIRQGGGSTPPRWYSVLGPDKTVDGTIYGDARLLADSVLRSPVWDGGAFHGGVTPPIAASADYTWGMRYYQAAAGTDGYMWGNRYGQVNSSNGWTFITPAYWRNYYNGYDRDTVFALPAQSWHWVWCVKAGSTITLYDEANSIIAQVPDVFDFAEQELGIAGGTLAEGNMPQGFRYQRFLTATTALTAAQRQAIQNI